MLLILQGEQQQQQQLLPQKRSNSSSSKPEKEKSSSGVAPAGAGVNLQTCLRDLDLLLSMECIYLMLKTRVSC
jgi:hypothetical protein